MLGDKEKILYFVLNNQNKFTDDEVKKIHSHYQTEHIFRIKRKKINK